MGRERKKRVREEYGGTTNTKDHLRGNIEAYNCRNIHNI